MDWRRRLAVVLWTATLTLPASAQSPEYAALFGKAWNAWHRSDYQSAYDDLAKLRALPYGRQPVVDFMLGTSACRLAPARDYGARLLDWLLYAYALTADSRRLVAQERDVCRSAQAQSQPTPPERIVELRSAGMSGYGKTFYWANSQQQPVDSYPIRRLRDMPRETFTGRLVPLGHDAEAAAMASRLAGGDPVRVKITSRFILVSHGVHTEAALDEIGRTLDRFVGFLVDTYGVLPPPHYLRVELVKDGWAVSRLADRRHGLDVAKATVGYAFVDDSSIVAAVPTAAAGTVLHELFHLLVRSNFGDIPQWLDEGLASLYEVSGRRDNVYFGLENWRRDVLKALWSRRPDVATLIRTEWFMFDAPAHVEAFREVEPRPDLHDSNVGADQAAMMATARYFALYLQEKGLLAAVYAAMRDRGFGAFEGSARDHAVELVADTLGRPIDEVDREFAAWFQGATRPVVRVRSTGGTPHVTTARVNVRTGPGTGFERLLTAEAGTVVAVTGEQSDWRRVELEDGTTAYIHADFLVPARR